MVAFLIWTGCVLLFGYLLGYFDGDRDRRDIERRRYVDAPRSEWEHRFWDAYRHLRGQR